MTGFPELLASEIKKGLPGTEVQWQMGSSDRFARNFPRVPGPDARPASVLILLFPDNGSISTVFMQRPEYDGVHSGQISFPGGKQEAADPDSVATALREAREETGVNISDIKIIGTLTPLFIPVSNMIVTPVAGWTGSKPLFRHDRKEVMFLFEADIAKFFEPSIIKYKDINIKGEKIGIRYFDYEGNMIWGATAMIMNELLFILRRGGFFLPG
jgi:8-oxo-dGTP pyrophosphatase MutT (NUDIX family)